MPVVALRKATILFSAAAVIVLCVGAVLVVPSAISKNRINNNNSGGGGDDHSSFQTSDSQGPDIFKQFQQQRQEASKSISGGGSISDRYPAEGVPAPAPSMILHAAPTLEPSTKAPSLGSDYPSIVPAQWGTVAPTVGWQQLITDKGRRHANKVKRQRRLRESYHEELRKRRLTATDNKQEQDNNNNKA